MGAKTGLYPRPAESLNPNIPKGPEVKQSSKSFHDALLAILDKREITKENIDILEENLSTISLNTILGEVQIKKQDEDPEASSRHVKRHINNTKSRVIESFSILEISFALGEKRKTAGLIGEDRTIEVNHNMIRGLRDKIDVKLQK